jgi:hypothetical protein
MIYLNIRLFTHWCLRRGPSRSAALRQHFTNDPLSTPHGTPIGKIPSEGYIKPRVYLASRLYSRMYLLPVLDHKDIYKTK